MAMFNRALHYCLLHSFLFPLFQFLSEYKPQKHLSNVIVISFGD
ncbi:hypothetical protein GBAG_2727 [Buttiauxella agrestis ATCC 33320]|uniref:Uncharacterized protein n=1 Tax=Buttiauxella agrestis ATCC 33320 TaxID=1006004 RepID=A0A085G9U2_9ENTR|nr:hypothetical protein GBAG_2727 [Buttiauxella agrestis ATCC 33320]